MFKSIVIIPFLIIYEILSTTTNQLPSSLDNLLSDLTSSSNTDNNSNPTTPTPTPSSPTPPVTAPTPPDTTPSYTPPSRPTPTNNLSNSNSDFSSDNTPLPQPNENYLNVGKNPRVGEYIADTRGLALYAFELDGTNESKCTGACAEMFLPLYVKSVTFPPVVAPKLDPKAVGLFDRDDGRYQASYNKIPLYLYKGDRRQGEIKGHKLKEFGGIWSLISTTGTVMDSRAAGLLKNLTNINTMNFYATGMASMVVIPDLFVISFNITASQSSLSSAINSIGQSLSSFKSQANNPAMTLTNKIVKDKGQNFDVKYSYRIVTKDPQAFSNILNAANQLFPSDLQIEYGVSDDLFYNSKNILYEMAVQDATQNANSLLANFNLMVNSSNPIRMINIDFVNIQSVNPVLTLGTLTYLPAFSSATPNIATLKAEINFNIIKSS